jgi:hypothetical protein
MFAGNVAAPDVETIGDSEREEMPIDYQKLVAVLDAAENALDIAQASTDSANEAARHVAAMKMIRDVRRDVIKEQCAVYEAALEAAGLSCIIATSWNTPRSGGCDGVMMLHDVCTRKIRPLTIAEAVGRLAVGERPEGATAWADAAAVLLALRKKARGEA